MPRDRSIPTDDLVPIQEATSDVMSGVVWGLDGTGKTLFLLNGAPLPIIVLNLDRPITSALIRAIDPDRLPHILIKNMRENLDDLDQLRSLQIKAGIESAIQRNRQFVRGGTVIIDGGSTFRDIIKLADSKIGSKIEAGQRFNPKDKAQVNAYLNTFVNGVVDGGANLFFTAHAAHQWEMRATDEGKNQLARTNRVYPKLDEVLSEQTALSILLMKKCACGQAITDQDGMCRAANVKNRADHVGRLFVARVVTNKYRPAVEGDEYEDFTFGALQTLCFGRKKREDRRNGRAEEETATPVRRKRQREADLQTEDDDS